MFFSARELRFSVACIVLASLLAVASFSFAVKKVGEVLVDLGYTIEGNVLAMIVVIAGYAVIVFGISYFFTNRFIGPFERLKTDMKIILGGYYHRRLLSRDRDDVYIRSFIDQVNIMLDEFEALCRSRQELREVLGSDIKRIIASIDEGQADIKEIMSSLRSLSDKLEKMTETKCLQLDEDPPSE